MYLLATPEELASAAKRLTGIGSAVQAANSAAATPTTQLAAAAEDEVSAAIAKLFGAFGQEYQALSAQAALFHEQFAQLLTGGAGAYAAAEAANASPLAGLDDLAVFSPFKMLTGRPLVGNGANGAAGTGAAGGEGGWLYGNGGNGGSGTSGGNGGSGG